MTPAFTNLQTGDREFDRTRIVEKRFTYGTTFVSRSEARRLGPPRAPRSNQRPAEPEDPELIGCRAPLIREPVMKPIAGLLVLLAAASAASAQEDGRRAFQRCGSCHVAPDLSLASDQVWSDMIAESA